MMQTESIAFGLLIAVFIIYLVDAICMLIDANTFFFDRSKSHLPHSRDFSRELGRCR